MATCVVSFSHDIEEKRFNIVVQRLVVQEEFSQQTQVLTINLWGRASLYNYNTARLTENTRTDLGTGVYVQAETQEDDDACLNRLLMTKCQNVCVRSHHPATTHISGGVRARQKVSHSALLPCSSFHPPQRQKCSPSCRSRHLEDASTRTWP